MRTKHRHIQGEHAVQSPNLLALALLPAPRNLYFYRGGLKCLLLLHLLPSILRCSRGRSDRGGLNLRHSRRHFFGSRCGSRWLRSGWPGIIK